jgi:sec-independent protein translocase protein TatA
VRVNFPGGWELVLVLLVVLVVFGSKRLPDSARALGRSLRIFKAETKGLRSDDEPQPRFDPMTGKPLEPPAGSDTTS